MPYAILAPSLPQRKLGIFMGLFNIFTVVPQLVVATVMGSIMKAFFPGEPIGQCPLSTHCGHYDELECWADDTGHRR